MPGGRKQKNEEEIAVHEFIGVKGIKAKGKRLSNYEVEKTEWLEPLIPDAPEHAEENSEDNDTDAAPKEQNIQENNKPSGKSAVSTSNQTGVPDVKQIKLDFE